MRLQKYIAAAGVCSRREAEEYIRRGKVTVNGAAASLGASAEEGDIVCLNGKRLLLVDDVISTGGSMHAIEALVSKSSGTIVGRCAVLAEGDAAERKDIFFLQTLPLFFHE